MLYCLLALVAASVVKAQDLVSIVCFACDATSATDLCALSNGVCLEDPTVATGAGYCQYNDPNSCGVDQMYMEGCCDRTTTAGDYYLTKRCIPLSTVVSYCEDLTDEPVCAEDINTGHMMTFANRNRALCAGYCDSRIMLGECLNGTDSSTAMPGTTDTTDMPGTSDTGMPGTTDYRFAIDVCSECNYATGSGSNILYGCDADNTDCYALRSETDTTSGITLNYGYCDRDDLCTPDTSSHSSDCMTMYGSDRPYCMAIKCCGNLIGATMDRETTRCVSDPVYYTLYTTCDVSTTGKPDTTMDSTQNPDTTMDTTDHPGTTGTDNPSTSGMTFDPPLCDECGRYANSATYWGCNSDGSSAAATCDNYYTDATTNEERGYCAVDECDVDSDCTYLGRPLCREVMCCGRDPMTDDLLKTRVNRRCVNAEIASMYATCDTSTTDMPSSTDHHDTSDMPGSTDSTDLPDTTDGMDSTDHPDTSDHPDTTDGSSTDQPATTDYNACSCSSTSLDFGCQNYYASFEAKIVVRSDNTNANNLCHYLYWYKHMLYYRFPDFCWDNIYIDTNCDTLSTADLTTGQVGSLVVYISGQFCNEALYKSALDLIDTIPTECTNELSSDLTSISWLDIQFDDSYGWLITCANDCTDTTYDCLSYSSSTTSTSGVVGLHSISMMVVVFVGFVAAMLF